MDRTRTAANPTSRKLPAVAMNGGAVEKNQHSPDGRDT
jgi:hypothetical protein